MSRAGDVSVPVVREFVGRAAVMLAGVVIASLPAVAERPNILFLLSDDQRPDTIGAFGNPVIQTPNLDALAAAGTSFSRATCAIPLCVPSRAQIQTGVSSFRNGVGTLGGNIDPSLATWAGTLRDAGYDTWYVGKWHNDGRPTDHGYDESLGLYAGGGGKWWHDKLDGNGQPVTGYVGWVFQSDAGEMYPERGVGLTPDISEKFADAAIEFIGRGSDKPWFLHVNFTAPHDPLFTPTGYEDRYNPEDLPLPANFRPEHPFDHGVLEGRDEKVLPAPRTAAMVQQDLALYYRIISHLDDQVGRLLAALDASGERENTIVIYTSDHGLAMGSHGLRGKQNMYEHTINVPLILSGPGVPSGQRLATQCYLRDLFPTTCELTGITIPDTVDGRSLLPALRGEKAEIYEAIYGHFWNVQRMIRTDRWKLIVYPSIDRVQLFDIQEDPHELRDLSREPAHRNTVDILRDLLDRQQRLVADPEVRGSVP